MDLGRDHIAYTYDLPLIHRDPFDRLLIAQSIVEGIPLITADKQIQQYNFPYVKA
ncbi:MAG: PIN domain-containing protein [Bacteroidota bacterium]